MQKILVILIEIFGISLILLMSSANAQCKPGDILVGEDESNYYCREITTVLKEIDGKIEMAENQIANNRAALVRYQKQLPQYVEAMEEWLKEAQHSRKDVFVKTASLLGTLFFQDKIIKIREKELVTAGELKETEKLLFDSGLSQRTLQEALRKSGAEVSSLRQLQYRRKVLETLHLAKDIAVVSEASDVREKVLEGILSGMAVIARDPRINILIAELEFSVAVTYAHAVGAVGRERIEQLLSLNEEQIRAVKSLTDRHRKLVDNLVLLRAEKRKVEAQQ